MPNIKSESMRGRSPGPAADRRESSMSELGMDSPSADTNSAAATPARTSKRRKRSELSPSSKQTHSIIEKERREAMNEKFSELAANIPELVEALAAGKRPTKGEIVKASIARHQEQERRVRELMHEVHMLRSGSGSGQSNASYPLESPAMSVVSEPIMSAPVPQTLTMPYQIQPSAPIGLPTSASAAGNLWVGQLLNKGPDAMPTFHDTPAPLPLLPELSQPVSPFKQTSMMNWSLSPMDPASLSIGFPTAMMHKSFSESGMLDQLSRRSSNLTGGSGFSSPTFTSSDSDSSFGTDHLDPSLDERKFLAESMGFEPFPLASAAGMEQTPLSSLVGLPEPTAGNKKARHGTNSTGVRGRQGRKEDVFGITA